MALVRHEREIMFLLRYGIGIQFYSYSTEFSLASGLKNCICSICVIRVSTIITSVSTQVKA